MAERLSVEDIYRKYGQKIQGSVNTENAGNGNGYSREYRTFKDEMAPQLTRYEKWCRSLGSVVKINVSKKDEDKIRGSLETAHLDIEPWQSLTLSVMAFAGVFL